LIFNYHVLVPGVTPAIILMAVVGVPVAALQIGAATLLQSATADEYRGRVLGAIVATGALSTLIGAALGGLLGDRVGIVTMLNVQGVSYFLAGLIVLWSLSGRRVETAASAP
jgi:predicted MFS family arabinose efflux permease